MKRVYGILLLVVVFVAGSTVTAWARSGSATLEVFYRDIKLVVDGVTVQTSEEPFILNGRTYVPLRVIAEALGEQVDWDGATSTVLIGRPPTGPAAYLSDMRPFYASTQAYRQNTTLGQWVPWEGYTMAMGSIPYKIGTAVRAEPATLSWNLNGQYQRLSGLIGLDDSMNHTGVTVVIYGDNKPLLELPLRPGDLPQKVDLNVTGVLNLKVYTGDSDWQSMVDLVEMRLTPAQ